MAQVEVESPGGLIRLYRGRVEMSRNALAKAVPCDPSYLTRIENGDRYAPRRDIMAGVARVLRLNQQEKNRLMISAGYLSDDLIAFGTWPEAMQSMMDVLRHPFLSEALKQEYRGVVQSISTRYILSAEVPE